MTGRTMRCASLAACLLIAAGCATQRATDRDVERRATLALLATTDLHGHVLGYDYYRLREDPGVGLDRVATLIAQARQRYPNTVLVDNGDTLQGTPLADWQARVRPPDCQARLAIHAAMDLIGYDAATLGNHEFNYGLPFLSQVTGVPFDANDAVCRGPDFPWVLSNVVRADTGESLFPPRLLLERTIRFDPDGGGAQALPLRIGIIGLTPPGILKWDARHLAGRVEMVDALDAARRQATSLREAGAEVVIALLHGGLDTDPYDSAMDNPGWHLAASGLVDALVLGHEHRWFPDHRSDAPAYAEVPDVDVASGRVHGVPTVMPAFWGRALGVIELALVHRGGRWQVDRAASRSLLQAIAPADAKAVEPDSRIAERIAIEHQGTIDHVGQAIAESATDMTTFFADVGDVSAIDVVNQAQADYLRAWVRDQRPDLAGLPLLSAAAPFKTGTAGPDDYTQVPAGPLAIRHAADLYLYPNTLVAVKITGAKVKAWLEQSARRFNRIDPAATLAQALVDADVPGYNFDVIDGLRYVIDISRPVGERIVDLRHADGRPVEPDEWLLVATNNYRAGGGMAFGLDAADVVIDSQVGNRDVLIDWLRGRARVSAERSDVGAPWRFAPLATSGDLLFTTRAGLARTLRFGPHRLRWLDDLPDGRARYVLTVDP